MATSLRLYKREKLRSLTAIDTLFQRREGASVMAYPLRAIWRVNTDRKGGTQFLIVVPKKRLRHAVDRVTMRRRIREAYRINRDKLQLPSADTRIDMAFVYVADELLPYQRIESAVIKALRRISAALEPQPVEQPASPLPATIAESK